MRRTLSERSYKRGVNDLLFWHCVPESISVKRCGRCQCHKRLDDSGRNASQPDGYAQYCKACFQQINRDSYRKKRAQAGRVVHERRPLEEGRRWCSDCAEYRPEADFPRNVTAPSGFGNYCKPHHNQRGRESKERRGGSRGYHLLRRYGVSEAEVADMIERQGRVCPICVRPLGTRHHVDHDHETGDVRGVLCFTCNGGLGNYGDDAVRLRRAADYLDRRLTAPSRIANGVYDVAGLSWRRNSPAAAAVPPAAGTPPEAPDRVAR